MTVLTRYVLRRLLARTALLLGIFLAVLVGGQLAMYIGRGAPPAAMGPILVFMLLMALPVALPMALTSAVLVTVGEMRRDGEFQCLASAGIDPLRAVRRIWPVVAGAMLASAVLWHWAMPMAMQGIREQSARIFQAMIATRVTVMEPIWQDRQTSAWATHAEGRELADLFIVRRSGQEVSTVFAPEARWELEGDGVRFTLDHLSVVQRRPGGEIMSGSARSWSGVVNPAAGASAEGRRREPDTLPTPQVWDLYRSELAAGRDRQGNCSMYNNARLTLHLRLYMPVALLLLSVFAAGVAMTFAAAESLLAIGVMIVAAVVSAYPAIGYVKSHSFRPQMDPGILLWAPGLAMAAAGWVMLHRPERVREWLAALPHRLRPWRRRAP